MGLQGLARAKHVKHLLSGNLEREFRLIQAIAVQVSHYITEVEGQAFALNQAPGLVSKDLVRNNTLLLPIEGKRYFFRVSCYSSPSLPLSPCIIPTLRLRYILNVYHQNGLNVHVLIVIFR